MLTIITPTYLPDIHRFEILRESIKRNCPDIHQLAIVDYRHISEFGDRFGREKNLTLVSTREVLPGDLFRQVQLRNSWLWRGVERVAWNLWLDSDAIRGWKIQQIAKIHALSEISSENGIFLDSDVLVCRAVTDSQFVQNGNTLLLESSAENGEDFGLDIATYAVMRHPLHQVRQMRNFVHVGATFKKRTAKSLLDVGNLKNGGKFEQAFLRQPLPSEYNMLGYVATVHEAYDGYCKASFDPRNLTAELRHPEQLRTTSPMSLFNCHDEKPDALFMLLQSNLNIDPQIYKAAALHFLSRY